MEMILKLTDSLGLLALLILLLIGALSVLLVIAISAWEVVSIIKKHRTKKIKKKENNHTFLHILTINKDETVDRFSLYKKIYTELKPLLIVLGATEDQASRASNIYCVKHLNEIFNDYEASTCNKKSDWKFASRITYNK